MNNFNRQELIDALMILNDCNLKHSDIDKLTDEELIWEIITTACY
jgi:hypothetical protein